MDAFDVVIVGSGASGGWAAKHLSEAGLRVALVEAGRPMTEGDAREHVPAFELPFRGRSKEPLYRTQPVQARSYACDEWNRDWYASDLAEPYTTPPEHPFPWVGRTRLVGGRTNIWGRQVYRFSDLDFRCASQDGFGVDWPVTYAELAPYYDVVERYIGVSGAPEGSPWLPDGVFQPPMPMTCAEVALRQRVRARFDRIVTIGRTANVTRALNGRAPCHYCGPCERGCVTRSYFSAAFTTVPDALATGRCTLFANALVSRVLLDAVTRRATGVFCIDRLSREAREIRGRVVILCAQMFESVRILFNSRTRQDPEGLGNASGLLGQYLTVHITDAGATAEFPEFRATPSLGQPRRPNGIFTIRFRNLPGRPASQDFIRGYGYQGGASAPFDMDAPGFGDAYKRAVRAERPARIGLQGFGECLPYADNACAIDPEVVDAYGVPVLKIRMTMRDNERRMLDDMAASAAEMLEAAGGRDVTPYNTPRWAAHEVGCARMGHDPKTSVLNAFQQLHDVPNVFVMDGSGFASGGWQNPTLTIMALALRSCDYLLDRMRRGEI